MEQPQTTALSQFRFCIIRSHHNWKSWFFSTATPEICEEKVNAIILRINWSILNWQRSGQGDCGVDSSLDDDQNSQNFGSINNCSLLKYYPWTMAQS